MEPTDLPDTGPRMRTNTNDDVGKANSAVLPRIPNPITCLSAGDMVIFDITINHTGSTGFIYFHADFI